MRYAFTVLVLFRRQENIKPCAFAGMALRCNFSAKTFNHFFADGKAQACSGVFRLIM